MVIAVKGKSGEVEVAGFNEASTMNHTITQRGPATILTLEGNLMGGPDATALNATLHQLVEQRRNQIVIDLARVEFMNSSGLGLLIGGASAVKNAGGVLKLAHASAKILTLIKITKLESVLETYASVDDAIASLKT